MATQTYDQRPDERFEGKSLPFHVFALPVLAAVIFNVGFWLLFERLADQLFLLSVVWSAALVAAFVGSLSRNFVALDQDHVTVSVWHFALSYRKVPYTRITKIEADDTSGVVRVYYLGADGDTNIAGTVLKNASSASAVADSIRLRRPEPIGRDVAPTEAGGPPPAQLLDADGKPFFWVGVPTRAPWVTFWVAGTAIVIAIIFEAGSEIVQGAAGLVGLIVGVAFIMTTAHRYSKYLIIHDDEVDVRTGVGEKKHRINFARIVEVTGFESGWINFRYNKTPTLGLGSGLEEVGIEIKPHSVAPALAAYFDARRDEVNRVSLYGRTA